MCLKLNIVGRKCYGCSYYWANGGKCNGSSRLICSDFLEIKKKVKIDKEVKE